MKFSRKFQKLLESSLIVSVWERAARWTHPVNTGRIFESLNKLEFERIRERAPYRPNPKRIRKFIKSIQGLWLDRSPPLSILDLGCGAGYFLISANYSDMTGSGSTSMRSRSTGRRFSY